MTSATRDDAQTILVVEDDEDVREAIAVALEAEGYRVLSAENGRDALSILTSGAERPPCVVLLDLMMPVMSGVDLLDAMRDDEALKPIPVLILSAWEHEGQARRAPAQGFLRKPVELDVLLRSVAKYC